jgi:hypothetical protein
VIKIGPGCIIEEIEYKEQLEIDPTSVVKVMKRIEEGGVLMTRKLTIFGDGVVGGGEFGKVRVYGDGVIESDVLAKSIKVFGSATFNGKVNAPNGNNNNMGGFMGATYRFAIVEPLTFYNCINNATITALNDINTPNAGGFMGRHVGAGNISFENCVNNGDVNFTTTPTGNNKHVIAGFLGLWNGAGTVSFTNCINNGDITAIRNGAGTYNNCLSAGAFVGNVDGAGGTINVTNCINTGDITAADDVMAPYAAPIAGWSIGGSTMNITNFINTGAVSATTNNTAITAVASEYAHTIDATVLTATACATVNSETFKTTDDTIKRGIFSAKLDKNVYEAAAAMAAAWEETVEVSAIITLDSYVAKIGEFTREDFDAFYEANKTAITAKNADVTKLYIETNSLALTDADLRGDKYSVGIALTDPLETGYTARTCIKIGDLYIYSK